MLHACDEHGTFVLTAGHVVEGRWGSLVVSVPAAAEGEPRSPLVDIPADIVALEFESPQAAVAGTVTDLAVLRLRTSGLPAVRWPDGEAIPREAQLHTLWGVLPNALMPWRVRGTTAGIAGRPDAELFGFVADASIEPEQGMSGSPVVTRDGRLLGILVSGLKRAPIPRRDGEERKDLGFVVGPRTVADFLGRHGLAFLLDPDACEDDAP